MPIDYGSKPSAKVFTIPDNRAKLVQIGVGADGTGSLEFVDGGNIVGSWV